MITIRVDNDVATYDGLEWRSSDRELASTLNVIMTAFEYSPAMGDRAERAALYALEALGAGEIVARPRPQTIPADAIL